MAVRVLIDRPALTAALRARGMRLTDDAGAAVAIVRAEALGDARCCPAARVLAVARDEAEERAALVAGADDAASGSDALLSLRAARLLAPAPVVRLGSLRIDRLARSATRADRPIALLPREYALLDRLARSAGQTVSHAELRRALSGLRFDPGTNVLAVHVSRLRSALHRDGAAAILLTDRGRGYRLVDDRDASIPS